MFYLAIDLGSSYIKSALINPENGEILERNRVSVDGKLHSSNELVYEISMRIIMDTVLSLIERYKTICKTLKGIVLSTQMHGFVLSDNTYGEDIYISWQDARCLGIMPGKGESYLDHMKHLFSQEKMRTTGVYLKPALGMCNLYALMHERKFVTGRDAEIYTLGSYIIAKLTGSNICHITNAAPLGLVDIEKKVWRDDLIRECGFIKLRFPALTADLGVCGYYDLDGDRIPVYPDVGDMQCAALGSYAKEGDVIVNMATAGQIIRISESADTGSADPGYYEIRPYFNGGFCHVISRMPGGRNLDVLIDFIRGAGRRIFAMDLPRDEVWELFLEGFRYVEDPGILVDVSYYELPEKLSDGAITGIDRSNFTLDNLMSAAFNDIGKVYGHYLRILSAGRIPASRIVFSGGAIRNNPILQQIIVKETGLPGRVSPIEDEVLSGLSQIAAWCAADNKDGRGK